MSLEQRFDSISNAVLTVCLPRSSKEFYFSIKYFKSSDNCGSVFILFSSHPIRCERVVSKIIASFSILSEGIFDITPLSYL